MRIFLFAVIFIFNCMCSFCQNLAGDWQGNLEINGRKIPIVFHFYNDSSGKWEGKWDSPSQNAIGLPYSGVTANTDSLVVGLKAIAGFYSGKFITTDSIAGNWHQGPAQLPLNISKNFEKFRNAQLIPGPNEKEIAITVNQGTRLYGTLLSKNNGQKLAIIIAGSGPTDRNGNNPMGVSASSYKMIADELDTQNIATFRYDKRGIGKSVVDNMNESDLVFDDYIKDAEKIFEYMHDSLGYKNIYFIGHSEGSLIGIIASQRVRLKGFISVSGAGRPIDEILTEQLYASPKFSQMKSEIASIFSELKSGKKPDSIPAGLESVFRPSIQPYMISWLKYSPVVEIKKLRCQVLILQGTCDVQIKIEDAENLHNANKKSTLDTIPLMTHTLKNAEAGCKDENSKTYHDPSLPLNKELVNDMVNFIKK
ncbi:MAG: alpha/beta fold hydrolase [Ginsengibacter sp.]